MRAFLQAIAFLIITIFPSWSIAAEVQLTGTTLEQLCSYDPHHCRNLSHLNGSVKKPKRTILVVFQQIRQRVREIARRFDIDPRVLIAVITTEHTLNVTIDDVIQDIYSRTAIGANGRLGPLRVSYGFGQIYADAAEFAEPVAAEIEGRERLTPEKVNERLQTMDGALTYAAALLLHARRVYAQGGFDISNHPGVLATLYNIGKVGERLERTQREGRLPGVNYFGWFVEHHWQIFDSIMNDEMPVFSLSAADYEAERVVAGRGLPDHYPIYFLRARVPLFVQPDRCGNVDRGDARVDAYLNVLSREMRPKTVRGDGKFNILQQALGCQGETWALARFSSGTTGWLRQSDAGPHLQFRYEPKTCQVRDYESCLAEVRAVVGASEIIEMDSTNGVVSIKIANFPGRTERDYRTFRESCYDEDARKDRQRQEDEEEASRQAHETRRASGVYQRQRERFSLRERMFGSETAIAPAGQYWYQGEELEAIRREIEMVSERLRPFASEEEVYFGVVTRLLAWTESFRFHCREHGCTGPDPSRLRDFFTKVEPDRLRELGHLNAVLMEYGKYSDSRRDSSALNAFPMLFDRNRPLLFSASPLFFLRETALHQMEVGEQVKFIDKSCAGYFAQEPALRSAWEKYKELHNASTGEPYVEDTWLQGSELREIELFCRTVEQYLDIKEGRSSSRRIELGDLCAGSCDFSSYYFRGIVPATILFFSPSRDSIREIFEYKIRDWTRDLNSFKEYYESIVSPSPPIAKAPARQAWRQEGRDQKSCLYDPVATIERIEKLLRVSCVDQVLVPNEEYLLQQFGRPDGRGTMVVLGETDRFQLTLNPQCRDENSRGRGPSIY